MCHILSLTHTHTHLPLSVQQATLDKVLGLVQSSCRLTDVFLCISLNQRSPSALENMEHGKSFSLRRSPRCSWRVFDTGPGDVSTWRRPRKHALRLGIEHHALLTSSLCLVFRLCIQVNLFSCLSLYPTLVCLPGG